MPNATHALGGIWRMTARRFFTPGYWLTLAGMLVLLIVFSIPVTQDKSAAQTGLLPWAGGLYICFLLPLLSFIAAAGAVRDDLGAGTVDYVFTRSVRRPVYIAFRYLSQMACTQIDFLFALGVVIGLGVFWDVPGFWAAVPRLLTAQVAGIIVFSALGFLSGLITARYVIIGLVYGAVIEVGLGNVPTQLNQVSLVRHLLALLEPAIGPIGWKTASTALGSAFSAPATVGLLVAVAAAMVAIAAAVFSIREFAGTGREG